MELLKAVYMQECSERKVTPQPLVITKMDEAMEDDKDFEALVLAGNSRELFDARLTDDDIPPLVAALCSVDDIHLQTLDLRFNRLGDAAAISLAELLSDEAHCTLRSLELRGNDIGLDGVTALASALESNCTLSYLGLNGNPLTSEGGLAVAELLARNSFLSRVDLGNTDLSTDALIALATVLTKNESLRWLNIERPSVSSLQGETTYHLAKMLQLNTALEALYMGKHGIRDDSAQVLAQHLQENRTLRLLDLRGNKIGASGGEAFAALLIRGSGLEDLNLAGNSVSNGGAFALGTALRSNRTLARLDLSKNSIKDEGLAEVALALDGNVSLTKLFLWGNDFGVEASKLFASVFDTRFKYFDMETDFAPYIVDGEALIAQL